ncbi:hypothetical protein HI914_00776 [Erysiphe necator]|nr:hypothetical protein HI914_00776 [Erysiphe necator]
MSLKISGSIQNFQSQGLPRIHSMSSTGSSKVEMDIRPDLSRPLESMYSDEKMANYYTPDVFHYHQETQLVADNSEMGIAITTNTAQLLLPYTPQTSSAYCCPFPLPSRSTSLRASTSVLTKNPPPVPPKVIKNISHHNHPLIPCEQNFSIKKAPIVEEKKKFTVYGKAKRFPKRLRGLFSRKLERDPRFGKATIDRVREGRCTIM